MASTLSEPLFNEAKTAYQSGDIDSALSVLFRGDCDQSTLVQRLVGCRVLEDLGRIEDAENAYFDILETFTENGVSCPLALFHYLLFLARNRSVQESLSFFNDLYFSESDHLTHEVYSSIAIGVAWEMNLGSPESRLESAVEIFRKGLGRVIGTSRRMELVTCLSNFLAFAANKLKLSEFELSRYLSGEAVTLSASPVWEAWEKILLEFNSDLNTVKAMYKMKKTVAGKSAKNSDERSSVEDSVTGIVTLSDFPELSVESWLLEMSTADAPSIHGLMKKLTIGENLAPTSAVLESVLGVKDLIQEDQIEVRDGGSEPTNHVYRPDTTKMLKYNPHDFAEKRVDLSGLPSALKNLIALLPSNHALKCANTHYIADQCIRLLVSVNLPVRSEELLATVDKRTRAAYEQKYARATAAVAPTVPVKVSTAPAVFMAKESAAKVKKEEIFDPVEYYSRQQK
jgi:hypothetical protein